MRSLMWALFRACSGDAGCSATGDADAAGLPRHRATRLEYAYAIDECTNKGYDYADLYVADGAFLTSRNGKILNRFEGRERLAEAARGVCPTARTFPGRASAMLVNHVIEPAPRCDRKGLPDRYRAGR